MTEWVKDNAFIEELNIPNIVFRYKNDKIAYSKRILPPAVQLFDLLKGGSMLNKSYYITACFNCVWSFIAKKVAHAHVLEILLNMQVVFPNTIISQIVYHCETHNK